MGRHPARRPERGGRGRPRDPGPGRGRHRDSSRAAAARRIGGLHGHPPLVEQRHAPLGQRHDEGRREAAPPPGDGPHEPARPRRRPLAHPGGGGGSPRPQDRLRVRRPRHRLRRVDLEHQPVLAHRQRVHHRREPARRDGEAREGRLQPLRLASSRRRRPSSTTSPPSPWRSSSRTRVSSPGGPEGSTTRSGWCGSWPSATASSPRRCRTSGSRPSSCGASSSRSCRPRRCWTRTRHERSSRRRGRGRRS